jgi:hypothetical protein
LTIGSDSKREGAARPRSKRKEVNHVVSSSRLAALAALVATIDKAKAEQAAPPSDPVSDPVSSSEEAKILKYWTKERRKEAKTLKHVLLG